MDFSGPLFCYPPLPPVMNGVTDSAPRHMPQPVDQKDQPPPLYWVTKKPSACQAASDSGEEENNGTQGIRKRDRGSDTDVPELEKRTALEAPPLAPGFATWDEFGNMLEQARLSDDPFWALAERMTKKSFEKGEYWSCIIRLKSGCHLECQLAQDEWTSTAFGEKKAGEFNYIELFEHDPATGITDDKQLVFIRIAQNYETGEWILINRGQLISGKESGAMAEAICRAMKIKQCFLADQAVVPASGGRKMAIKVPLQIMTGRSYYMPLFSLFETKTADQPILCGVGIGEEDIPSYIYHQDVAEHAQEILWLQQLKVQTIHNAILKNRTAAKKEFAKLLERHAPRLDEIDCRPLFERCDVTFQQLMQSLYAKMKEQPQALQDYEWLYFNLLDARLLTDKTKIQKRFLSIINKLYWNMLLVASFDG